MKNFILGISGASGSVLAMKALAFLARQAFHTHLLFTETAEQVYAYELERGLREDIDGWIAKGAHFSVHANSDLFAPVASGSFPVSGMVIMPCSMSTAAKIATGLDGSLLCRAASVCIKERTPLAVVPRESPMSAIHLRNLLTLAENGVFIMPPVPAFYDKHQAFDAVVDAIVGRALKTVGIKNEMFETWGG